MIEGVTKDLVPAIWPHVEKIIDRAIDHDRWRVSDVKDRLLNGHMQLWLVGVGRVEGVIVTEINVFPKGTECTITICAGVNREAWIDHLSDIESWASAQGCRWVVALNARKGWMKQEQLKPYRMVGVTLQKEIEHVSRQLVA